MRLLGRWIERCQLVQQLVCYSMQIAIGYLQIKGKILEYLADMGRLIFQQTVREPAKFFS